MGSCIGTSAIKKRKPDPNAPKIIVDMNYITSSEDNWFQSRPISDLSGHYQFYKEIYTGQHSAVSMVKLQTYDRPEMAIKSYKCSAFTDPTSKNLLRNEIEILKILDHPNIFKYHTVFSTAETMNIAAEHCNSGDLLG